MSPSHSSSRQRAAVVAAAAAISLTSVAVAVRRFQRSRRCGSDGDGDGEGEGMASRSRTVVRTGGLPSSTSTSSPLPIGDDETMGETPSSGDGAAQTEGNSDPTTDKETAAADNDDGVGPSSAAPLILHPVGVVSSVYRLCVGTPRQGLLAPNSRGRIDMYESRVSADALEDLAEYSHLWVVFAFHLNSNADKIAAAAAAGLEGGCRNKGKKKKRNGYKNGGGGDPEGAGGRVKKKKGKGKGKGGRHQFPSKISPPALGGTRKVGLFSTRTPHRPNPVGLTLCRIDAVHCTGGRASIDVSGLDLCDGTPVLDVKPYVPHYDSPQSDLGATAGRVPSWVEGGLGRRRTVNFSAEAERQLRDAVARSERRRGRRRNGGAAALLEFYGPGTGRDASIEDAAEALMRCVSEVLGADVRSAWQTAKARKGRFQAERAGRVKEVLSSQSSLSAAVSGTSLSVEGGDGNKGDGHGGERLCTQQLDSLLIRYTVSAPPFSLYDGENGEGGGLEGDGASADAAGGLEEARGSGALDIVTVRAVECLNKDADDDSEEGDDAEEGEAEGECHNEGGESAAAAEAAKGKVGPIDVVGEPSTAEEEATSPPPPLLEKAANEEEVGPAGEDVSAADATGADGAISAATMAMPEEDGADGTMAPKAATDNGVGEEEGEGEVSVPDAEDTSESHSPLPSSPERRLGASSAPAEASVEEGSDLDGLTPSRQQAGADPVAPPSSASVSESAGPPPPDQDFKSLKTYWSSAATKNTPSGLVPRKTRMEKQKVYSFSNRRIGVATTVTAATPPSSTPSSPSSRGTKPATVPERVLEAAEETAVETDVVIVAEGRKEAVPSRAAEEEVGVDEEELQPAEDEVAEKQSSTDERKGKTLAEDLAAEEPAIERTNLADAEQGSSEEDGQEEAKEQQKAELSGEAEEERAPEGTKERTDEQAQAGTSVKEANGGEVGGDNAATGGEGRDADELIGSENGETPSGVGTATSKPYESIESEDGAVVASFFVDSPDSKKEASDERAKEKETEDGSREEHEPEVAEDPSTANEKDEKTAAADTVSVTA